MVSSIVGKQMVSSIVGVFISAAGMIVAGSTKRERALAKLEREL